MSEFGNRVTSWKAVEIDGEKIATPSHQGVQISRNLVQSAKTRRTANATWKVVHARDHQKAQDERHPLDMRI